MPNVSSSIYNCILNPGFKSAKGFIETDGLLDLNWKKYFDDVEKHPNNEYILLKTEECSIIIFHTGFYEILQAKTEEICNKYVEIIKKVVNEDR